MMFVIIKKKGEVVKKGGNGLLRYMFLYQCCVIVDMSMYFK